MVGDDKLEGGIDDTWYHEDIDGEFDVEWHEAIKAFIVKEKETAQEFRTQ